MDSIAKFNIGDLVIHKRQGYRAVVIDVDPLFQASGRHNPQALKRVFCRRSPWYRLLVDQSSLMTYVEESLLMHDSSHQSIDNPKTDHYLVKQRGVYRGISRSH